MNLYISPIEKTALELRHKKCRNVKESNRIKAILLSSEGWTIPMIAHHESTVSRYINDYQEDKLTISSGGSTSMLNENYTEELKSHLNTNIYRTNQEIIWHIFNKYGVTYSVSEMNKWLHSHGFSYKKFKGYSHKASPEQ